MGKLKQKSEFNETAAELLINANLYAPSVHCSYYSCLQLFKHIICHSIGRDYIQQKQEANATKGSSHIYIKNAVLSVIPDETEKNKIRRQVDDLKRLRVSSDYNNESIDIKKATKAQRVATEIKQKTKKFFKI